MRSSGNDDAISGFVSTHYDDTAVAWFNRWEAHWMEAVGNYHLPDVTYSPTSNLPGLLWFYAVAVSGAVLALGVPSRCRLVHWTLLPVLGGVWFATTLTGALVPRYRFLLEPFWLLYFFFVADGLGRLIIRSFPAAPAALPVSP